MESENISSSEVSNVFPNLKINVFISSVCGDNDRFDRVRKELKNLLENTQYTKVYCFEETGASSMPVVENFEWQLEDSDVAIFLIDNAVGVTPGVQKEIDIVQRDNIKALAYFCNEVSTEKTKFEEQIKDSGFIKSKTIEKFDDISKNGAQDLIDEIAFIYHSYCKNRLIPLKREQIDGLQISNFSGGEKLLEPVIPKAIFKNIDQCKFYILKMALDKSIADEKDQNTNTCNLDEWGRRFFSVLFEAESIKNFNVAAFLNELKNLQKDDTYHKIVCERWKAIQANFNGNVTQCVLNLEAALKLAKDSNQQEWIIQDILIDLRNQQFIADTINNRYTESPAQRELTSRDESLYYPLLDRFERVLNEKYIKDLYKQKIENPYSVTIGNDLDEYSSLLASSFLVSIYNGSLTHILIFYERMKDFLFYLSCKYDNWNIKRDLLKLSIFACKSSDISGIQNSYPETLNEMTAEDAVMIMDFCNNHTVHYQRLSSQLLAFGVLGYYLDDEDYSKYETLILGEIDNWLDSEKYVVDVGNYIFKCLTGIAFRVSQDILAKICIKFIEKHRSRWFSDLFKFMAEHIDITKMSRETAATLIEHIIEIIDNPKDKQQAAFSPRFLCVLRNQDQTLTDTLDSKIKNQLPQFYNGQYKLETTKNPQLDYSSIIQDFIQKIQKNNDVQGRNGHYSFNAVNYNETIRAMFLDEHFICQPEQINALISTLADTVLISKETVAVKLNAISLLCCIVLRYPEQCKDNFDILKKIANGTESIIDISNTFMNANIDKISLQVGLCFLKIALGMDAYSKLLECMPYIHHDDATTLAVTELIGDYLETNVNTLLPENIDSFLLQNDLQWLNSSTLEIRRNGTKILFSLLQNPRNKTVINNKIVELIDSDGISIKNLIMRRICDNDRIDKNTYDYVMMRCENDANFLVRKVCKEVKN